MLGKVLIFIIGIALGIATTYYNRWLVRNFGTISWAEKVFGNAGTYLMWQLTGVFIIICTLLYVFDKFGSIVIWIAGFFR